MPVSGEVAWEGGVSEDESHNVSGNGLADSDSSNMDSMVV